MYIRIDRYRKRETANDPSPQCVAFNAHDLSFAGADGCTVKLFVGDKIHNLETVNNEAARMVVTRIWGAITYDHVSPEISLDVIEGEVQP